MSFCQFNVSLCDYFSGFTWNEAHDLCKEKGMYLPSFKTTGDEAMTASLARSECGLITFMGLRRNKEVS